MEETLRLVWQALTTLPIPVAEKMIRPILVYLSLVILLRIFGKRELAQLNPFDLVVLLSLSNTVQNAIIGNDNSLIGGLIGAATLLAVNYVVVRYVFRHRRVAQFLAGSPTVLIENGQLVEKGLAKEMLTKAELTIVAHRQGFNGLADVDYCLLEPGGLFDMRGRPLQPKDAGNSEILARLDALSREIRALKGTA